MIFKKKYSPAATRRSFQRKRKESSGGNLYGLIIILLLVGMPLFNNVLYKSDPRVDRGTAWAETVPVIREVEETLSAPPAITPAEQTEPSPDEEYRVQSVLSAKRRAVIASGLDARIIKFNVNNGDVFKKDDVLIEYDCGIDYARLKEAKSRQKVTQMQFDAYEKLRELDSIAEIELVLARENNEQNKALIDQINGRLKACQIKAPFDGRVTNKMASQYEFVQTGRVLMDISSREALRAEFLVPSKWLRWLNVGTPLQIYIGETDRNYKSTIVAIHGEVDPVSQSVQVVAEIELYHEELLPGMSGQAVFDPATAQRSFDRGFLGLALGENKAVDDGPD